jgi:hypothetical protein
MSNRIRTFQRLTGAPEEAAKITHVAGVFQQYPNSCLHRVQESTTLNTFSGEKGVQMSWLDEWLPEYDGEVYVRKMDFIRNDNFFEEDFSFWVRHKDDPYESGIMGNLELLLCGLRLHRYMPGNYSIPATKNPHCSELKALRINHHGLWRGLVHMNRMPPWMWWFKIDDLLNCPISKPIRIK